MDHLIDWFTHQGIRYSDSVRLVCAPVSLSVSVRAVKPIPINTVVAVIPKSSILSRQTSAIAARVAFIDKHSQTLVLSLCLLYEAAIGSESKFDAYVRSLPTHVPIATLWEEGSTAREWIQGTTLEKELRELDINRASLQIFHSTVVLPLLTPLLPDPTSISLPRFLWSYSIISSRAFQVDSYHGLSLVPLADLFNHSSEHQVHFQSETVVCPSCGSFDECVHDGSIKAEGKGREAEDYDCHIVSNSPIDAGEVFNTYGPAMSNTKLATFYGFIQDDTNEFDRCYFSLDEIIVGKGVDLGLWRQIMEEYGYSYEVGGPFVVDDETEELYIDEEGRLSVALWILSILLAAIPLPELATDDNAEEQLEFVDRLRVVLGYRWALIEGEELDPIDISSVELGSTSQLARTILTLLKSRLSLFPLPSLSPSSIYTLADESRDPSTKLAMKLSASERTLLHRTSERYHSLQQ